MSNAERRLKNVEVLIRGTNESRFSTNKVSFLGSCILLLSWLLYLASLLPLASCLLLLNPFPPLSLGHTEKDRLPCRA